MRRFSLDCITVGLVGKHQQLNELDKLAKVHSNLEIHLNCQIVRMCFKSKQ